MKRLLLLTLALLPPVAGAEESLYGTHTYLITGYYSPLPGQSFYATGSYETDLILNGEGLQGADGTKVYPGMLAAPGHIPFGTQVCIPGFGCGTVHDRGGAIVDAGVRPQWQYPRLDVWTGYGEEGLQRALQWGMTQTEVTLHPPGTVASSVNFSTTGDIMQTLHLPFLVNLPHDLQLGDTAPTVEDLHAALGYLGFYNGAGSTHYTEETRAAVLSFQRDYYVVEGPESLGAGRMGPASRAKLQQVVTQHAVAAAFAELWEGWQFTSELDEGSYSTDVYHLQQLLQREELLSRAPTGYFGSDTKAALTAFQLREHIIASPYDQGAGRLGPRTTARVNALLSASPYPELYPLDTQQPVLSATDPGPVLPLFLAVGDTSPHTQRLQRFLITQGYHTQTTGYFGPLTKAALQQYQQHMGLNPSGTIDLPTQRQIRQGRAPDDKKE